MSPAARRRIEERRRARPPFFSVCVPQYNRTSFLLHGLRRLAEQTFADFEVCISDDCSTDGRGQELLDYLETSGMGFVYERQGSNLRYDGNLRASIALASGRYALLMGNDDCLSGVDTLERLHRVITGAPGHPAVVLTNYKDLGSGRVMRRVRSRGWVPGDVKVATRAFRNFSFVSGVLLDARAAQAEATTRWDGSEMYQMYIGTRLLARGGALLNVDEVTVQQGIRLPGEEVDSYARRPRLDPCPIVERRLPLGYVGRLVIDAVEPCVRPERRRQVVLSVFGQVLMLTYPFWLWEYRRVQSWRYSAGLALWMRPGNLVQGLHLGVIERGLLAFVYVIVTVLGLTVPVRVFDALYPRLYALAKTMAR
jgi:hypothetical protein